MGTIKLTLKVPFVIVAKPSKIILFCSLKVVTVEPDEPSVVMVDGLSYTVMLETPV